MLTYAYTCVLDICVDMCVAMGVDMCVDMRADVFVDMRADIFEDRDMYLRHVHRHCVCRPYA